jgi:hypothetical protein
VAQFMNFEETDFPTAGAIQNDHMLLRLCHEWQQKLNWGQLSEFKTDLTKTIRAVTITRRSILYDAIYVAQASSDSHAVTRATFILEFFISV